MNQNNEGNVRNKSQRNSTDAKDKSNKKPFDKKTYRLKKYSNKYKVDQWEDRRKKAVLRQYYKEVRKDQKQTINGSSVPATDSNEKEIETPKLKGNAFFAAKKEFQRKQEEKLERKKEAQRRKEETAEALKKYKEAKALKYKKLSKKTKKGQPVMKDRMEMLLEKIQQSTSNQ